MISEGDLVLLFSKGKKILLQVKDKAEKIKDLGVFNSSRLIGKNYGEKIEIANEEFFILSPSTIDKIETIERRAQIILPKDTALIIFYCDIKNGSKVIECGIGSGALTIALLNAVGKDGKVISYEIRNDFACLALKNIKKARLEKNLEIRIEDCTKEIKEKDVDAIILDISNPWDAIENCYKVLKNSGNFCSFSPTINQVEKTVLKLRELPFINIKTYETLQREIVVNENAVRPSFEMLGHTGYLTFARKVIEI